MIDQSLTDGIINFRKPTGITSARALDLVRAITRQRKSGHAGSLDPCASGVLVICLGRATKLVERIMEQPKVYRVTARFDVTSASFDLEQELMPVEPRAIPTSDSIVESCRSFEGLIDQIPPATSAIKIDGVPAYKRHRRGQALVIAPKRVRIDWMHVHRYEWPEIEFEVCCGRGTYIRALIRDWGERLGTGGCLTSLTRVCVGPFHLQAAWTAAAMKAVEGRDYVIDLERARRELATIIIPSRPARECFLAIQ